jgi:2-(1,2-epoxy-1,2-dihydrophenyl)acetyl-CoA isomerase
LTTAAGAVTGFANLELSVLQGVATLRLTRLAAKNALNMALKQELAEAIAVLADREDVRCLVITGQGNAFSAGGDIGEMALNVDPVASRSRLRALLSTVFIPLAELEMPTIAAVNGHAHGAGLSLALACDLILASDDAVMSCAFSRVGLIPDCGALYFLPRRVPVGIAKELIFTGRRFGAAEALAMGLVNRVVPAAELDDAAAGLAAQMAASATVALGLTKTLLARSLQLGLREMSELEAFGQAVAYSTADHLLARQAFAAKQQPAKFAGC